MHVREHIEDFIMLRISIDADGRLLGVNGNWQRPTPVEKWWPDLYVDPNDNIIKETAALRKKLGVTKYKYQWPEPNKARPDQIRRTDKKSGFVNLGGCWFSFILDRYSHLTNGELYHDIDTGAWRTHKKWVVVTQKQLSKKQLKQHGLINGQSKVWMKKGSKAYG